MNDKPQLSRSRHKRTQQKTKKSGKRERSLTAKLTSGYLFTLAILLYMLNTSQSVVLTDITPGQLAPYTVQAEVDFESVDLEATQLNRERAAAGLPYVLRQNTRELNDLLRRLNNVTDKAKEAAMDPENGNNEGFRDLLRVLNLQEGLGAIPQLFSAEELERLNRRLPEKIEARWRQGLVGAQDRETGFQGTVTSGKVQITSAGEVIALRDMSTADEAAVALTSEIQEEFELSETQAALIEQLLSDLLEPNVRIDLTASQNIRSQHLSQMQPVRTLHRQGATVMEARMPVTQQIVEDLMAHQQKKHELSQGTASGARILGQGLLLAVGLAVSLAFLYLLENPSFSKGNRIVLWVVLTIGSMLLGRFLIYLSANVNLIPGHYLRAVLPLAVAPMLGTILFGPRLGLAVGFSTSLGHAMQHEMDLVIFFCGMCATVTSAISVRAIHRRSNLFRAGLWIGGIQALILIGSGVMEFVPPLMVAQHGLAAFVGGLVSALIVLLFISPFELMFGVTTDIRLLELSDMSHPLLARMALEAPGTYHHSLMVAHLSQAAAREIRVNDLLVRVCAYYHDIGKLTKPEFFIENSQGRQNPHDDLSPSMSRLLIISHVKEGVSLAKRYKLPPVIVQGIEQHHGTSVIQYFYHRAKKQAEDTEKSSVKPEDFRYPGPKPRTAEMGILMLADALEAASRTIDKSKPGQIDGLVNEIIREKLQDGQLDHCPLTMLQLNQIRRSFIFSLNNMLHGRVAYPQQEEENKESNSPARAHSASDHED